MSAQFDSDIKEIDQRLIAVTELISNRVRTIAGGLLLLGWGLLSSAPVKEQIIVDHKSILIPMFMSVICLFIDVIHYIFNYLEYLYQRNRVENGDSRSGGSRGIYWISAMLFVSKIILVGASAFWLIAVLGRAVLTK